MKWLKYTVWSVITLVLAIPILLVLTRSSLPLSDWEISSHATRLNEAAAIQIPHFFLMDDVQRNDNLALLLKVEVGQVLSASESATYRSLFQKTLFDGQRFLGRFDGELTVLQDVEMESANNVGSLGINGNHDHHDVSARRNYKDVEIALLQLDSSQGFLGSFNRIKAINLAQKSLADIISHMGVAPHTISVPYRLPGQLWREDVTSGTFENMVRAYKDSQFLEVNSAAYWEKVDEAVAGYALLVHQVQNRLWQKSAWWERRIAGRFLDFQTLAPQIDENIPLRKKSN